LAWTFSFGLREARYLVDARKHRHVREIVDHFLRFHPGITWLDLHFVNFPMGPLPSSLSVFLVFVFIK
jgi:hypothetical protein|tara:strand:- start:79 stop:282 length:204 start_codon:yes stop_codon:yes gene_type:complete